MHLCASVMGIEIYLANMGENVLKKGDLFRSVSPILCAIDTVPI